MAHFGGCCAGGGTVGPVAAGATGEPTGAPAGAAGEVAGADAALGTEDAGAGDGGAATRAVFTEAGSLSALANSSDICHICVSVSDLLKPGMPVRRKPFAIFQ